jgi:hypothetical protein
VPRAEGKPSAERAEGKPSAERAEGEPSAETPPESSRLLFILPSFSLSFFLLFVYSFIDNFLFFLTL